MKRCTKCGKTHDDSRDVCSCCSMTLTQGNSGQTTDLGVRGRTERWGWNKYFWGKIATKEEAKKIIEVATNVFYGIACFRMIIAFFLGIVYIAESILLAVLAFLLYRLKSRVVAGILLTMSILGIASLGMSVGQIRGVGMVVTLIMLGAGIRAVQATSKYEKLIGYKPDTKRLVTWGIVTTIVGCAGFFGTGFVCYYVAENDQTYWKYIYSDTFSSIILIWVLTFMSGTALLISWTANKVMRERPL